MRLHHLIATGLILLALIGAPAVAQAGSIYVLTTGDGADAIRYEVRFGGGKLNEQWTAFDPESKKFVYLEFRRGTPAPEPAGKIFNHTTGEIIPVYQFPGVKTPLPIIPNLEALKQLPFAKTPGFNAERTIIFD